MNATHTKKIKGFSVNNESPHWDFHKYTLKNKKVPVVKLQSRK
jgi:hypothetical protein